MLQCTHSEAASFLGIPVSRFRRLLQKDERVKKAWEEGIEAGKLSLRRKQLRLATTNAQMAIHLGKQYLGQTDQKQLELTGKNGGPIEGVDLTKLSPDERKQLRSLITKPDGTSTST